MSSKASLGLLAKVLILVGGIIIILGAILQAVDLRALLDISPNVRSLGMLSSALIGIIVGVLALIGASRVSSPVWMIILVILGYLVGSLGGILIFIGALIGLVTALVKT